MPRPDVEKLMRSVPASERGILGTDGPFVRHHEFTPRPVPGQELNERMPRGREREALGGTIARRAVTAGCSRPLSGVLPRRDQLSSWVGQAEPAVINDEIKADVTLTRRVGRRGVDVPIDDSGKVAVVAWSRHREPRDLEHLARLAIEAPAYGRVTTCGLPGPRSRTRILACDASPLPWPVVHEPRRPRDAPVASQAAS